MRKSGKFAKEKKSTTVYEYFIEQDIIIKLLHFITYARTQGFQ